LVRFFASRQRNEQPANHAVREELAMFLSFDNTNTMVYLSLKYRYYHLLNVFVLEEYRGLGLGKFLMNCIMNHTELQGLKRWMLGTEDAHGLYEQYGFTGLKQGAESYGKGDSIFAPGSDAL
jgi:GNAT superfamily N-acetyltransferase